MQKSASNALNTQKAIYDKAYHIVDQALELDHELGRNASVDVEQVKDLYIRGLDEIRRGLELEFSSNEWQAAQVLEKKMKTSKQMVEERLHFLQTQQRLSKQSAPVVDSTSKPFQKEPVKIPPNLDAKLGNYILNEILVSKPDVTWDDVSGLDSAKRLLQELVILPSIRPDLYTGLRAPAKGVLLFGPPGTGKTLLAKAVANECNAHFFALSSASLVSKYLGESEKLVRTLFELARYIGRCVLFFDEIDSILGRRSEQEHEASRRLKTEFLIQFDGVKTDTKDNIVIIGATNRPQELDEAARRRFTHRILIPLPEPQTRKALLEHLLKKQPHSLTRTDFKNLVQKTDGYSCSDITALAKEAALWPLRELTPQELKRIKPEQIRKLNIKDFEKAQERIRASVSKQEVELTEKWAREFGSQ